MHQLAQLKAKDQRVILSTNIRVALAFILISLVFTSPPNVNAQCDWTFYADSLTKKDYGSIVNGQAKITGTAHYDVSKEYVDENGTKHIYTIKNGETSSTPIRITIEGVVYGAGEYPVFRLCDELGAMYVHFYYSNGDVSYMQFIGVQPYNTLGKIRLCKFFLQYQVKFLDTITEADTTQPFDTYVWDIDSNGQSEVVIPIAYHILADSLGEVNVVDFHHHQDNPVIGIWFGSRFVGDSVVGVHEENESSSFAIRLYQNNISLLNIAEADIGTTATIQLYDLYGRLLITEQTQLLNNAVYPLPLGSIAPSDLCAWVVRHSNGRVTRGLTVVE